MLGGSAGPVPNVKFAGIAKVQADVYTGDPVALCHAFMHIGNKWFKRIGIKCKALEAISYECVPVINEVAFGAWLFTILRLP
jgi:hypothetical protein